MRAVVTRVRSASVTIDGRTVGKIGRGFLILLGVGPGDGEAQCRRLAEKALGLRVFEDENGKMNLGLEQVGGQVLVVSQFTLYGNCRKGRRPSFTDAANPELGERLYEQFLADCASLGYPPQHGRFGADMKVESINDGPVTLILDVAMVLSTARVRVKEMSGKDLPGGRSAITIRFEVKDVAELESVRTKLLNIRDVVGSRRGQN